MGHAVILTATLSASTATGKVTFYDGVNVLGTAALSSGQATLQAILVTVLLPSGNHSLKAYYPGDSMFAPSTSPVVTQTVVALPQNGFLTAVGYYTGPASSQSVAIADFNRDGKPDLALAGFSPGLVSVMLGNGDGTFQNAATYSVGGLPLSVAVGDFNGDGKADLVVANYATVSGNPGNTIGVLLGNGDGTFLSVVNYTVGTYPFSVAVADFNEDGKADIAVANNISGTVSLLLGNGNGTFQTPANFSAGRYPTFVAVGDFNRDGHADLAVANQSDKSVTVMLGNGNGGFSSSLTYNVGDEPFSIAVGDFNGDGNTDLAVANYSATYVSVLLGHGDGTFNTAVNYNVGSYPRSVAVGDFNGDGKADLAVAYRVPNTAFVAVLLGYGDGTFQAAVAYVIYYNFYGVDESNSVAVADLNGDGVSDLAAAYGDVAILLGVGTTSPPNLNIAKTHTGNFLPGQTGASYTIGVSNQAGIPTTGTVTVSDALPAGLTAATISGAGWTCAVATVSCARSDTLGAGLNYPPITLTVNVANQNLGVVTNTVTVSGGGASDNAAADATIVASPLLNLSSLSLNFGSQAVGFNSASQTVTLTNGGNFSFNLALTISGDFAKNTTCGGTLAPGASCTVTVTFNPLQTGLRTGALSVSDGAFKSPQLVRLFGIGIGTGALAAKVSLSSLALDFSAAGTQAATLTNSGGSALTVNSITASGDFTQSSNCSSVAAFGSCTINVSFAPGGAGVRRGLITIVDTAPGSPHVIRLFGMGSAATAPVVSLSSISVNFGDQTFGTTSVAKTLSVSNTGNATLNISGVAVSGDFAGSGCLTSLAPGASCTLSITFTPTSAGVRRGTVTLTNNSAGSPQLIRLFGNGI